MKIRLLNDGHYCGLDNVVFPAEVEAEVRATGWCDVSSAELHRVGGDQVVLDDPDDPMWPFGPGSWEYAG